MSSRRLSLVGWPFFNEPERRPTSRACARRSRACQTQDEPCSRRRSVFACGWVSDHTPATLFESCGVDCTLACAPNASAAEVRRATWARGHSRDHGSCAPIIVGSLARRDCATAHHRGPCPSLPRPPRVGSSRLGTLDDARRRLTGHGRPHRPAIPSGSRPTPPHGVGSSRAWREVPPWRRPSSRLARWNRRARPASPTRRRCTE